MYSKIICKKEVRYDRKSTFPLWTNVFLSLQEQLLSVKVGPQKFWSAQSLPLPLQKPKMAKHVLQLPWAEAQICHGNTAGWNTNQDKEEKRKASTCHAIWIAKPCTSTYMNGCQCHDTPLFTVHTRRTEDPWDNCHHDSWPLKLYSKLALQIPYTWLAILAQQIEQIKWHWKIIGVLPRVYSIWTLNQA